MKTRNQMAGAVFVASLGLSVLALRAQEQPPVAVPEKIAPAKTKSDNSTEAPIDDLKLMVTLPDAIKAPNIAEALGTVSDYTPVVFSREQVNRHSLVSGKGEYPFYDKPIAIPAGTYSIEQLLRIVKQIVPSLRWAASNGTVNLIATANNAISNPLDIKVKKDATISGTPLEILSWITQQSPDAYVGQGGHFRHDIRNGTDKISLQLHKGMTLREVLNLLTQKGDYYWNAETYLADPLDFSMIDETTGKVVLTRKAPAEITAALSFSATYKHEKRRVEQRKAKKAAAKVPASPEPQPQTQPG